MLCSREEFSFRNVYVSMLAGTKQLYTQKWFKKFRLETPCLDDNVKSKEKRQSFKLWKPISLSIFIFFFNNCFVFSFILVTKQSFHYDSGSRICPLRQLVLKTNVTLVQTLRLVILDFVTGNSFSSDLPGIPSPVIGACILMQ